jgi:DNA-binding CsgD family transcriptional regulator
VLPDGSAGKEADVAMTPQHGSGRPSPVATMRVSAASFLLMAGRPADAAAEAEAVLLVPGLPEHLYANAELARLQALMAQDEVAGVRGCTEAILAGTDPSGDAALSGALTALGFIAWGEGRCADAVGLLRAAVQRAELEPERRLGEPATPRLALAGILTALGEFEGADELIAAAEAEMGGRDAAVVGPATLVRRASLELAAGRIETAVAAASAAEATAELRGTRLFLPQALSVLAVAALQRGDREAAIDNVDRLRHELPCNRGGLGPSALALLEARLAVWSDDLSAAMALVRPICDALPASPRALVEEPAAAPFLVRVALAGADDRRAEGVAVCARQLAAANESTRSISAAARHAAALVDRDAHALELASREHVQPWGRASALEDAGAVLAADGLQSAAIAQLGQALSGFEEVGAFGDAARVQDRLRGARSSRRGRGSSRPRWGWDGLTETERRVSGLVAGGLTNAQAAEHLFLSRHTVDSHLRQIYRKLGIRSRVDLTRVVTERRGDLPTDGRPTVGV